VTSSQNNASIFHFNIFSDGKMILVGASGAFLVVVSKSARKNNKQNYGKIDKI